MTFCSSRRRARELEGLPLILNGFLIGLGSFIVLAMTVIIILFEEFTAFTDYTQQWIEFNFFIHYWDKLTIARVYLWFIFIYGFVLIAISAMQIHGMRKKDINFLHLAPLLMIALAIVTVLGAICWLIVTAVNYNEGFLATGGFIFERMRFKGNVWKDLIYREQSWRLVTENRVPRKAPILAIWVHQRERDFECCGWDSYMDYAKGNFTNLPESCCKRRQRLYGCGNDFQWIDRTPILNYRGCRNVMYAWYRAGFIENIIMSIIGLGIAAYEFYLYSVNRREYYKLLDEMDDMRRPMMNATMSMSTINSKGSCRHSDGGTTGGGGGSGRGVNLANYVGPTLQQQQAQRLSQRSGSSAGPQLPQLMVDNSNSYLQKGRMGYTHAIKGIISTPSDRVPINDMEQQE